MGSHPLNLALRFALEIIDLLAVGYLGWKLRDDWTKYILVFAVPVFFALLWGVFAVPDDPVAQAIP